LQVKLCDRYLSASSVRYYNKGAIYSHVPFTNPSPLIDTLSNVTAWRIKRKITVTGTLAVDGRAVTFGTARRGLGGLRPRSVPSSLYQM